MTNRRDQIHNITERPSLIRGRAFDAIVAAVIADEEMRNELEAERLLTTAA